MEGYLGETPIDLKDTEYANFTKNDWILSWITWNAGIDGAHHKDELIDQIVRIATGSPIIVSMAKWKDGTEEERMKIGKPTKEYHKYIEDFCSGEDGPQTYAWIIE